MRIEPPIEPDMTVGEILDMYASEEWFWEEMAYLQDTIVKVPVKYIYREVRVRL